MVDRKTYRTIYTVALVGAILTFGCLPAPRQLSFDTAHGRVKTIVRSEDGITVKYKSWMEPVSDRNYADYAGVSLLVEVVVHGSDSSPELRPESITANLNGCQLTRHPPKNRRRMWTTEEGVINIYQSFYTDSLFSILRCEHPGARRDGMIEFFVGDLLVDETAIAGSDTLRILEEFQCSAGLTISK